MNRKALALILSFAILMTVCVPGSLASKVHDQDDLTCENVDHIHNKDCYTPSQVSASDFEAGWRTPIYDRDSDETISSEEDSSIDLQAEDRDQSDSFEPVCTCTGDIGLHKEDCPLYKASEAVGVREIRDDLVTLVGNIPEDVELVVENHTPRRFFSFNNNDEQVPLARLNITLYNPDGSEWQPDENQPVTVTLDAKKLGLEDGSDYIISHIHEDEHGETITDFCGVPDDGELTFDLDGFSYVLVFNGQTQINGVEAFYPTELVNGYLPKSTNGAWGIIGLYYDDLGNAHVLLGFTFNNPPYDKLGPFYVNGNEIENYTYVLKQVNYSSVTFKNEQGDIISTHPTLIDNKSCKGYFDVNVGNIEIGESFTVAMDATAGGFNIPVTTVNLVLEYDIVKSVAKGTNASGIFVDALTVERGDWIIYKIALNNTGTLPLQGMKVTDVLPVGVFDMSTVQMSIDGEGGAIGNWEPFNSTLFDNYSSPGEFSRLLYIKAQVLPDLNISTATTYTNTARIEGMNMPIQEDMATITVNPPNYGKLTVSKAVTSENPNDPADMNTEFTFRVQGADSYDHTFKLKSGESELLSNVPVGSFTVTETQVAGFTTKVNGITGNSYYGEMASNASPVVAFENRKSTVNTSLSIKKLVEKAYENDVVPADDAFTFKVTFSGEGLPGTYPYTVGSESGSLTNGGTISLKAGQTATITGIPKGVDYTVIEDLGLLAEHYQFSNVTGGTLILNQNGATGTMENLNGESLTFTNIYKRHLADLTITKTGSQEIDENQTFIFHVAGQGLDLRVVIQGNGSKTIKDLPLGTYTVTEESGWSWRYTPTSSNQTCTLTADGATVAFSNTRDSLKWLNGAAYKRNAFLGFGLID